MFALFTDGNDLDQIVETIDLARREADDLSAMGCTVKVYQFPQDFDIESWMDQYPTRLPTRAIGARLVITRI